MGGTAAIGIRTENGQVYYHLYLLSDFDVFEIIEMLQRKTIKIDDLELTADSIYDFFEIDNFENEGTGLRIVQVFDEYYVRFEGGKHYIIKCEMW